MKIFLFIIFFIALIFSPSGLDISAQVPLKGQDSTGIPYYRQEEVSIKSGDVNLAGTLTLPFSKAPVPLIILLTGSGQQNRDEEILGFKIFGLIAAHLSKNGFAVLRCDDRGIGGSTGNIAEATIQDFLKDALAGIEFAKRRPEINQAQIGFLGHSEGGIAAQMAASQSKDVSFIILLSAPGVSGDTLIKAQIEWILKASGASKEEIQRKLALQQKVFDAVRTNTGWEELKKEFRKPMEESYERLSESIKSKLPPKEEYIGKQVEQQLSPVKTPWFRHFIDFKPSSVLKNVHCPVLMIFGGKDMQVPTELNKHAMIAALEQAGNTNYLVREFPEANHLYQQALTGSPYEYATLKKDFVPGFLNCISDWLKEKYPQVSRLQDYDKSSLIEKKSK